ncbi:hypothetical protein BU17DRAFT_87004 [Hysterangium stoloniferum]|nr:hypothetical protein BU17DRAFT_87004 [Hysterangium stoloniferum]
MPKFRPFSSFRKLDLIQRLRNHVPTRITKVPVRGKRFLQWPLPGVPLEPPVVQMFLKMQKMTGQSDMLSYFSRKLEEMDPGPAARREWYHRAISICTKAGQMETALSFCKAMVENGINPPIQTYMTLFRGMSSRNTNFLYLRSLQSFLTSGAVELDDFAFQAVMDSMVAIKDPPQRIAKAFRVYSAVRSVDSRWIPPPSMYTVIIRAYASTGQVPRAQYWLNRYRKESLPRVIASANSPESKLPDGEHVMTLEEKIHMKLGLYSPSINIHLDTLCRPYTAIFAAYARSPKPPQNGVQWLFEYMLADNISPDIELCNTLISAFFRWGWNARACAIFDQLLTPPVTPVVPNAQTFRLMFRGIAPTALLRRASKKTISPPIKSRPLFHVMIAFTRLRLARRAVREDKNPISCATFNATLNTFMRENDYAAAWVIVALFPHYNLLPNRATIRTILVNLLARMRSEIRLDDGIFWIDRFLGAPRDTMFKVMAKNEVSLADNLYKVGRSAYSELVGSGYKTFLQPSPHVTRNQMEDMRFLVALLRRALIAELRLREDASDTERTIIQTVKAAYRDLLPQGRDRRRRVHVETPPFVVIKEGFDSNDGDPS